MFVVLCITEICGLHYIEKKKIEMHIGNDDLRGQCRQKKLEIYSLQYSVYTAKQHLQY